MTTWYVDYEGGTDANSSSGNGDSFATRRKTISNCVAAAIAPGDAIRIMGTPAATSLGITAAWTGGGLLATKSITSSTNATPIAVTITSHGYATGDTVIIAGHTTNTNANGTWEITSTGANTFTLDSSTGNGVGGASGTARQVNSGRITLASALTANIASFANRGSATARAAWTASANVTATLSTTDFKSADASDSIAVAAGFTTGLAAYFPTGTLDLSTYKQISFWIKQTAGTVTTAGQNTITLCSDAAGVTAVDTFNIPGLIALNYWVPVTVDKGSALGASIQSIALNVVTDVGAQTFLLSNFIACKDSTSADSLTLNSLVGKNSGTETWYCPQSINGTRVMLDRDPSAIPNASGVDLYRGYSETTETVTTYKREPVITTATQAPTDSGTSGNLISYSGGWDRAAMTTQDTETWYQARTASFNIFYITGAYNSISKLNCVRGSTGFLLQDASNCTLDNVTGNNCGTAGVQFNNNSFNYSHTLSGTINVHNNKVNGLNVLMWHKGTIENVLASNNGNTNNNSYAINFGSSTIGGESIIVTSATVKNNTAYGVSVLPSTRFLQLTSSLNSSAGFSAVGNIDTYARSYTSTDTTPVTLLSANVNAKLSFENYGGTAGFHKILTGGATIQTDSSVRHTASGVSWSIMPTSTTRAAENPVSLPIAKVACAASALVTVTAWMRRSNTGLTMRLKCKGGQIGGVASDVSSSMSAAIDTWEQLTITFTPSAAGVVEITAEAHGGTTYTGYVDDITVGQA